MSFTFDGKIILITGGAGTIGVPLAKKLLEFNVETIRLFDQDDSALTFAFDFLNRNPRVRLFLGKIEDKDRLNRAFAGVDIVFHLAAIKHVMVAEYNPFDTINTNVVATQNVIIAALNQNVSKVIFSSSDKSVNPTNTYGSTKLLGEKLIIAANLSRGTNPCIFSIVRFGNLVGSRGSVIPRFIEQLKNFNKILITKRDMTRFIMFLDDAVNLLIKSCKMAKGGEIFVLKMIPIKLGDLAECILEFHKNKFPDAVQEEVGLFEGEKLYEELLDSSTEGGRTVDDGDMFIILPTYKELLDEVNSEISNSNKSKIKEYEISSNLANPIEKNTLYKLLIEHNILY